MEHAHPPAEPTPTTPPPGLSPDALMHLLADGPTDWCTELDLLRRTLGQADADDVATAFADAARDADAAEYQAYVTPGAHGTDALGHLSRTDLATVGRILLIEVTAYTGQSPGSLEHAIPGVHSVAPSQMTSGDVAALADHVRAHWPDPFGRACARLGGDRPELLQHLLGDRMLSLALTHLATRYLHRNH